MLCRRSTFLSAVGLAFAALLPRAAEAQSCCAGATTVSPARLALHEQILVGLQVRVTSNPGSFDANGNYRSAPDSSAELDLAQDLVLAFRPFTRAEISAVLPIVETWRKVPDRTELGGGVGDLNLGFRYDFTTAGHSKIIPGIAALAGFTLPTGRAPDRASSTLATDATGIGAIQASAGVALEQIFDDHLLVGANTIVTQRFSRTVHGVSETLGLQLAASITGGWLFEGDIGIAGSIRYEAEGDATINGATIPDSARRQLTISVAAGLPLGGGFRLQGSAFDVPPISGLGQNLAASYGFTFALIWASG